MTGFDLRTADVESDRSTNLVTTPALLHDNVGLLGRERDGTF